MVEADSLRKAMGKKIPAVMTEQEEKFVAGCIASGHEEKLGSELFGFIEHFAGYGFNRSHSAAYALVAYQTAWLKAHYPAEYMAALLTASKRDKDRTALYLNECRTMGIRVLVPDVNRSESDFVAVDGDITFGLSAIRNVGEAVVELIVAERDKNGRYTDIRGLHRPGRPDRCSTSGSSSRSSRPEGSTPWATHAKACCSRCWGRRIPLAATCSTPPWRGAGPRTWVSTACSAGRKARSRPLRSRSPTCNGTSGPGLQFEKEMLGLYVSDHPLLGVEGALKTMCSTTIPGLWDQSDKSKATIGGIVGSVTTRFTKSGDRMLFFPFEDLMGSTEVLCFPKTVAEYGPLVREDAILIVSGYVDHRGDDVKFIAQELREPELREGDIVRLRVPATVLSRNMVDRLREALANHPGSAPVYLHMQSENGEKVIRLGDEHRVEPRSSLFAELRALLGARAVL